MIIKSLPDHLRPREKLLSKGPQKLDDAELLAIFLRTGIKGKSAIDLAHELLNKHGSLRQLLQADKNELCETKGIGITHYIQLKAALEIAKRHMKETLSQGDVLNSPNQVIEFMRHELRDQINECFIVIYLNSQHRIIVTDTLCTGSVDHATVYPREIIRRCLHYNASAVIFGHNHPSGEAQASTEDISLTKRLKSLLQEIDVRVLDHIIIGDGDYFSFAEKNM